MWLLMTRQRGSHEPAIRVGGTGADQCRNTALSRARSFRCHARGLATAAHGKASFPGVHPQPGADDTPVPGLHGLLALAVASRARRNLGVARLVGTLDDPRLSGIPFDVPRV